MDDIDLQDIKNITMQKIAISNCYKEKTKRKIVPLKEHMMAVCACLIFSFGIINATSISEYLYHIFEDDNSQIVFNQAMPAKLNSEYKNSQNGIYDVKNQKQIAEDSIKVKVDEVYLDDLYLDILFDINFSNEIVSNFNLEKVIIAELSNLKIENENQEEVFMNYQGSCNYYIEDIKDDSILLQYKMNRVGNDNCYPKCKYLTIKTDKIVIMTEDDETFQYHGNWNLSIDIPEEMNDRECYFYRQISTYTDNYVDSFKVMSNETEVKLSLKTIEGIDNSTSPQRKLIEMLELEHPSRQIRDFFVDKLMNSKEYHQYEVDLLKIYNIQDIYVEDAEGKKYEMLNDVYPNGGGSVSDDGIYTPTIILDYHISNMTDRVQLHVKYLEQELTFELVKEADKNEENHN